MGYPLARTGVSPIWDWGTPQPGLGYPLPGNGIPPGRDLGPVTRVPHGKDMGLVEVLWDGDASPPPHPRC